MERANPALELEMRAMSDQIVLAKAPDFRLGCLDVFPSQCRIAAAQAVEMLQPRIMQVLVALAERRGHVVSRDELMARCWGGFAVSDDAIHRCIARLRRLSETHGGFRLETVTRVGYQLVELQTPLRDRRNTLFVVLGAASLILVAAGLMHWL
jgi:DNA-binding winged helix-turn-helix (wHTH) protein